MEDQIIHLLTKFVAFRTIAGADKEKTECLDWIQQTILHDHPSSYEVKTGAVEDAPYLFLKHPDPMLLFFAHIDVVPAEDHQFTLKRDGDKLIGRGSSDMKGNQLPYLMAIRDAWERGEDPPVSILLTSDEETAGPTIPTMIDQNILGDIPIAFTPDCSGKIVCEHKGILWAELRCNGKASHAAYPWEGENPNFLMAEALTCIRDAFPCGEYHDWQMTVTPTEIKGETARNQIPSSVSINLDVRFPSGTPEDALAIIKEKLPDGCSLTETLSADALSTDPNHPVIQKMKSTAEDIIGKEVMIEREHGGTDARYFGAHGIPAFLFGPEGGGVHGKDEWVSLKSLIYHYEIASNLA